MQIKITENLFIGDGRPLAVIAGPCVIENEDMIMETATGLKEIAARLNVPLIFKSSYKKANRNSIDSFATIGIEPALQILGNVRNELNLPILTDIHSVEEAELAAHVSDVIQIPAFLCRQTDLIIAAAKTGKTVNIKKGQFMAPEDMGEAVKKVTSTGNPNVMLTERGTTFGYHNLVVDMRGLVVMRKLGCPVVFDATHSAQLPGGAGKISGGQPEFAPILASAAIATGACDAIFIETHPEPSKAQSDAKTQLPLRNMESILLKLITLAHHIKQPQLV